MKTLIYVEGPTDKAILAAVLQEVRDRARIRNASIEIIAEGDKTRLILGVPRKAVLHLEQYQDNWVFIVPDLYPTRSYTANDTHHRSAEELRGIIARRVKELTDRYAEREAASIRRRIKVHCFKYDVESLLLAVPDRLRMRLKTEHRLTGGWVRPVENQNDDHPPKYVVEELFKKYVGRTYIGPIDGPQILSGIKLTELEKACPQSFGPFIADLRLSVDAPGGAT